MARRVVVTGIGPVTSIGIGCGGFKRGLAKSPIVAKRVPSDFVFSYDYRSMFYVPFPDFDFSNSYIHKSFGRVLQREDEVAIIATELALEDAGFALEKCDKRFSVRDCTDACVIVGIGLNCLEHALSSYLAHIGAKHPRRDVSSPRRFNRMIIPMMMPNSPTAWISILFGQTGASYSINAACASGAIAIGEAFLRIKHGLSEIAIAGGVESLTGNDGGIMRGFDVLGALTTAKDGLPRPFSKGRSGFLFAEGGGCILILEELEHAERRGARVYAEICDYALNSEAHNIVQINRDGTKIEQILTELSRNSKIDYLSSHGTGTVPSDEIEKTAICTVFGERERQPVVNSTKGLIGHTIGASGAIEAAVTAVGVPRGRTMDEGTGPSVSVNTDWCQTARSCCAQKAWW